MRVLRCLLIFVFCIGLVLPSDCLQFRRPRQTGPDTEPFEEKWERQRQKSRNEERQKELRQETEKLYKLATELKDYVNKTDENTLSLDVIRKAEEIEKLAKKVREKMKADYLMPGPASSAR
jgi:hypothetical protein